MFGSVAPPRRTPRTVLSALLSLLVVATALVTTSTPAAAAGVTISGTVTDDVTGEGIDDVFVDAFSDDDFSFATTDESGNFTLTDVAPGAYTIAFNADGYAFEYYDDSPTFADATVVEVAASDITGIDAELSVPGTITGTIDKSYDAGSASDISYELFPTIDVYQGAELVSGTVADESGEYSIEGLAPGTYRVDFQRASGQSIGAGEFFEDKRESLGAGAANLVTVTAGGTVQADASLEEGGTFTGTILKSNGQPLAAGCRVTAFTEDGSLATRTAFTNEDGEFTITGLSSGNYLVASNGFGFPTVDGGEVPDCPGGEQFRASATTMSVDAGPTATAVFGADTALGTMRLAGPSFTDVDPAHVFADEMQWLATQGISKGYDNGDGTTRFEPSAPVLREQMAAFLYRFETMRNGGEAPEVTLPVQGSPFTDVSTTHVFYTEMVWLSQQQITTGYDNGDGTTRFEPSAPVLREQMAAFLYRFEFGSDAEGPEHEGGPTFTDVAPGFVFFDQIEWLAETGVTTGYDEANGTKTYRGGQPVLREQMAAFLFRYDRLPR
ncbi:hypothetical protein HMPREF0063_10478 [Aeromicrobium marinum DSM 15272]|uniref:SLH domain-containing protein n=1 Tax=Aeromicrobium marinum DSM 15272 TaxID=585531 RepID=E2S8X0_9ACTN|nr:carboxypeptidase regulatory-like domain-containing protein [Aeromicrobium marinum]EFQ84625.1 hypothetical protein HMPREF0063_10478 [Aeromicrobium marinum DSM 15272]